MTTTDVKTTLLYTDLGALVKHVAEGKTLVSVVAGDYGNITLNFSDKTTAEAKSLVPVSFDKAAVYSAFGFANEFDVRVDALDFSGLNFTHFVTNVSDYVSTNFADVLVGYQSGAFNTGYDLM